MDDQTRFWIAQQVADTKYTSNIQSLFKDAKLITERPNTMITDKGQIFMMLLKKNSSQSTIQEPSTYHIFKCKETTTTIKWNDSTVKCVTEKK